MKILKKSIATLWIAIISFFSKVFGQDWNLKYQLMYGTPDIIGVDHIEQPTLIDTVIKIAKRPLIGITLIVWIISFIKIRKTKNKTQKGKAIKRTIITVSILLILIIACIVAAQLLKKY